MKNMFNRNGQLNASDMQDAIMQLAKYASYQNSGEGQTVEGLAGDFGPSAQERDELISRAILSQDGKVALAQAMANPIRKNLDYQGMGRRALVVDPTGQGVIPAYERDLEGFEATVISSNGGPPESRIFGDRFIVPTFEIAINLSMRIQEIRRRRFNAIERVIQKGRQEIMAVEDTNIFRGFEAASVIENEAQDIQDGGMVKRDLLEIKRQIDRWDLLTSKFFMHINEFNDILMWGSGGGQGTTGGDVDLVTQREILQTGVYGSIWGADILVSKLVPPGTVYGCADPEFTGVMVIKQDIEVYPNDNMGQLKLGWVLFEELGLCFPVQRAIAKGSKNYAVG